MRKVTKRACLNRLIDFSMHLAENTIRAAVENEHHSKVKTQAKWMTLYEVPVPQHLKDQYKK